MSVRGARFSTDTILCIYVYRERYTIYIYTYMYIYIYGERDTNLNGNQPYNLHSEPVVVCVRDTGWVWGMGSDRRHCVLNTKLNTKLNIQ